MHRKRMKSSLQALRRRRSCKTSRTKANESVRLGQHEGEMLNFRLKSQKMCMYRQNPVSDCRTHQCPAAGHTSVQLSDTGVSSCRTPTEIYNHNNNHDTNSRRPEIGFKSSVVGRNDAKESSLILKAFVMSRLQEFLPMM